jgi:transcription antitermination protein NusB
VAARAVDLDGAISGAATDWTADRLGAVERNVLRIALYELDEGLVPAEVAIDEAIRLAKRYATEEASRLINGILGRIVRERATAG